MRISVYATPALVRPDDLEGAAAVVIDALRMTSVAVTAMQNGCAGLMAVAEIEEARALAKESGALLGGERNALQIEGFNFSNSPLEYTRARVGGQRLVMTTSNGTLAVLACARARRAVLGAFVNASAVANMLRDEDSVAIVCAGTLGRFTLEDALAAGAIVDRLCGADIQLDDMAVAARMLYKASKKDLPGALSQTAHYRRLLSLGLEADLAYCLSEDTIEAVPERGADEWFC